MADDQVGQLPTGIDPQRAALLQSLFPQGGAPPPSPSAPTSMGSQVGPLDDPNLHDIIQRQSQAGLGAFGEREKASMGLGDQMQREMAAQQAQAGNLSFHPNFHGGFLHNLGQALLTVGAATAPGQAVQDVVYSGPRQEYAGRAKRIEEMQKEQETIQQPMASAAQLAYKPFQAEAAEKKAGAAVTQAQARVQAVINQHQDKLAQIAAMKDIAGKRIAAQEEITRMRDETMKEITGMKDVTQEDVARIMASSAQTLLNTKIAEDPSVAGAIKRAFGIGGAQAPGGEQPVGGATPLPTRAAKAAAVPKGTMVYDPQGQPHTSDGTHPLPKGWSTKKPGA